MTCWKCGAQAIENTCTMCGCLQDTRQPAQSPNGKSLRYIYDKLGPAATLTNPTNFIRSLSDVFPDDEEFKRQMAQVLQTNVGSRLYIMLSENKEIDEGARRELLHVVRNKCSLSDSEIKPKLDLLLEMVGCPTIQQQAAPIIPKTTDKETKTAEKPCAVHQEIRSDDSKKAKEKRDKAVAKANKKQKQKADAKANDIGRKKEKPFWGLGISFTLIFSLSVECNLLIAAYLFLQAIYCFGLRNIRRVGTVVFLLLLIVFSLQGIAYDAWTIYWAYVSSCFSFSLALCIAKYSKKHVLIWTSVLLMIGYSIFLFPAIYSMYIDNIESSYIVIPIFCYPANVVLWWKEGGHKLKGCSSKKHQPKSSSTNLTTALQSLQELYKAGVITQEEYNTKRLEVLDRFENTVQ